MSEPATAPAVPTETQVVTETPSNVPTTPPTTTTETVPAPAAPAPAPATTTTTVVTPAAPASILHKVAGMLQGKGELVSKISGLEGQLSAVTIERDSLAATLNVAQSRLQTLEAQSTQLETLVKQLESSQQTVAQATVDQVAALGFESSALPAVTDAEAEAKEVPASPKAFMEKHAELNATDPVAASKFYGKFAHQIRSVVFDNSPPLIRPLSPA